MQKKALSRHWGTATEIGAWKLALHGMCGGHEVLDKVKVFLWLWSYLMVVKGAQELGSLKGVCTANG